MLSSSPLKMLELVLIFWCWRVRGSTRRSGWYVWKYKQQVRLPPRSLLPTQYFHNAHSINNSTDKKSKVVGGEGRIVLTGGDHYCLWERGADFVSFDVWVWVCGLLNTYTRSSETARSCCSSSRRPRMLINENCLNFCSKSSCTLYLARVWTKLVVCISLTYSRKVVI